MIETRYARANSIPAFISKVYGWMAGALAITGLTAYNVFATPQIFMYLMTHKILFYGLMFVQIGLVLALSFLAQRLNFFGMATLFTLYAFSLGVTLSVIFAVYTMTSIASIFGIAAGIFVIMALYGYFTKSDLTSVGNLFMMGLMGIILASVINMFIGSQTMDYVISFIGILIFTGLIAYNSQRIKNMAFYVDDRSENKTAILCALTIYLDFVNLFLYLLRFLGRRRD